MLFHAGVIARAGTPVFTLAGSYDGGVNTVYPVVNPVTGNVYLCGGKTVTIINPVTMTLVGLINNATKLNGVSGGDFNAAGTRFYVACEQYKAIVVINCSNEASPSIAGELVDSTNLAGASWVSYDEAVGVLVANTITTSNRVTFCTLSGDTPVFSAAYTGKTNTPQTISSITNVGTVATVTTAAPHLLRTYQRITTTGQTPAAYTVTNAFITVTGPTTFTYNMASDPGGAASVVGAYTSPANNIANGSRRSVLDKVNKRAYCVQDAASPDAMLLAVLDYSALPTITLLDFWPNNSQGAGATQGGRGVYFDPRGYLLVVAGALKFFDISGIASGLGSLALAAPDMTLLPGQVGSNGGSRSLVQHTSGASYYVAKAAQSGDNIILANITDINAPSLVAEVINSQYLNGPMGIVESFLTPGYVIVGCFDNATGNPTASKYQINWPTA